MNSDGILKLIKELIQENPSQIRDKENYLNHLINTYQIALRVVEKAILNYPFLDGKLNKYEIALAGGLHDIGYLLQNKEDFHELTGAKYIEENGLKKGISNSQEEIYRIAQMIRIHGFIAEEILEKGEILQGTEFEKIDFSLLIPKNWQEAMVIYSDFKNIHGKEVSIDNRIMDIRKRYIDSETCQKENPYLVRVINRGLPRIIKMCERVQELENGKLTLEEIEEYGFL